MAGLTTNTKSGLASALGSRSGAQEIENYLQVENVLNHGADPTGSRYSTTAFRSAINRVRAAGGGIVEIPDGTYAFDDSIVLTNPDSGYEFVHLRGSGGYSYSSNEQGPLLDFSGMTPNRPAIVVQGSRNSIIEGVVLKGVNAAPLTTGLAQTDTESDWITAGLGITSGQYNPYAGIAIDPWSGTAPGSPYTGATYGRANSAGVVIRNCGIWGFVCGVVIKPADDDNQCEYCVIEQSILRGNTYGVSVGTSQARSVKLADVGIEYAMTCVTGAAHGKQTGCCPSVSGGAGFRAYNLFDFKTSYHNISVTGYYAEAFRCIGYFGKGNSSYTYTASFNGCGFRFDSTVTLQDQHPFGFAAFMPTIFNGCFFETFGGVFNVAGGREDVTFNACQWRETGTTWSDVYYCARIKDWAEPFVTFTACSWITDYWTGGTNPANNLYNANSITLPTRIEFQPFSCWFVQPQKVYRLISGAFNTYVTSAITSPVVGATLSFTATTVAEFLVGDVLFWKTTAMPRASSLQFQVPMARVTDITSNTVTCEWLCNPNLCDATFLSGGGSVLICHREWAPGALVTGDTSSGTATISNVTSASSYIRTGDFISGTGIPSKTRVTNVSGTTVTISKNATATGTTKLSYGLVQEVPTILTGTATWDPPNLAAAASSSTTVTVYGAAAGDRCVAAFSTALADGFVLTANVSATNTVKVVLANVGGSTTDHASGTLTVQVFK